MQGYRGAACSLIKNFVFGLWEAKRDHPLGSWSLVQISTWHPRGTVAGAVAAVVVAVVVAVLVAVVAGAVVVVVAVVVVRHGVEESSEEEVAEAEAEEPGDEGTDNLTQYARRRMKSMNTSTHKRASYIQQLIDNQGS